MHQKQYHTDLRQNDLLKHMNMFSTSKEFHFLQENGKNLSNSITCAYQRYKLCETMLSSFCKSHNYDFSAKFSKSLAIETLMDLKKEIDQDLKGLLGEDHGIHISETIQWEGEKVSIAELIEGLKNLRSSFIEASAEKFGCKLIARKVGLVYTSAKTKQLEKADSKHIECLTYALFRLRDKEAARAIFFKEPIFKGRSCETQLETLIDKMGYRFVDKPQRGDFIVYINKEKLLDHGGVMVDEKTVHSKWGSQTDEILEHPIESVPEIYRHAYIFLRKEPSTLDEPWVLD